MGGKARLRFICVSDALNNGKTLTYGKSLSYGPFYCKSKVKGLALEQARPRLVPVPADVPAVLIRRLL